MPVAPGRFSNGMCSEIQEANLDGSGRCSSATLSCIGVPYCIDIDPPLLGVVMDTDGDLSGVQGTEEGVDCCGVTGVTPLLSEGVLVFFGFGNFIGVRLIDGDGGGIRLLGDSGGVPVGRGGRLGVGGKGGTNPSSELLSIIMTSLSSPAASWRFSMACFASNSSRVVVESRALRSPDERLPWPRSRSSSVPVNTHVACSPSQKQLRNKASA